jgi:DNA invertase Pin-like site-specific DNA recombinase
VFAEFKRDLIRERQMVGIAKITEKGVYIRAARDRRLKPGAIATEPSVSRTPVWKVLRAA